MNKEKVARLVVLSIALVFAVAVGFNIASCYKRYVDKKHTMAILNKYNDTVVNFKLKQGNGTLDKEYCESILPLLVDINNTFCVVKFSCNECITDLSKEELLGILKASFDSIKDNCNNILNTKTKTDRQVMLKKSLLSLVKQVNSYMDCTYLGYKQADKSLLDKSDIILANIHSLLRNEIIPMLNIMNGTADISVVPFFKK